MAIQRTFRRDQQAGWPGQVARPYEPHFFETGPFNQVITSVPCRPGDAVVWSEANNAFEHHTAGTVNDIIGIVSYEMGTVGQDTVVSGEQNSDREASYPDGAIIKVLMMGSIFAVAGGAIERFAAVQPSLPTTSQRSRWASMDLSATPDSFAEREAAHDGGFTQAAVEAIEVDSATGEVTFAADADRDEAQNALAFAINSLGATLIGRGVYRRSVLQCVSPGGATAADDIIEVRIVPAI